MPLEWFVFIGTFLEELISPIPSFLVMVPAGVAAQANGQPLLYLLYLAVIASFGRMIAGTILYFLADKLEDFVFANNRKFFGVSHKDVEGFGRKLSGKHAKHTWWILLVISAIPFLPTATLSLTCGFIKIRFRTFITSNFIGSIFSGFFFLYLGYAGLETAKIVARLDWLGQVSAVVIAVGLAIWWLVWRQSKRNKKAKKK